MSARRAVLSIAAALALAPLAPALADGRITGHARFERIKGRPQLGYVELYESNLFASPDAGLTIGPSRRLGAPPGEAPRGDGYFSRSTYRRAPGRSSSTSRSSSSGRRS